VGGAERKDRVNGDCKVWGPLCVLGCSLAVVVEGDTMSGISEGWRYVQLVQ
jgi:hypothetical protein